jgi:hypothetical protein
MRDEQNARAVRDMRVIVHVDQLMPLDLLLLDPDWNTGMKSRDSTTFGLATKILTPIL